MITSIYLLLTLYGPQTPQLKQTVIELVLPTVEVKRSFTVDTDRVFLTQQ